MQDLPKIRDQISRKDLFDAFKQQLAKDFEQCNCSSQFVQALQPDFDSIRGVIQTELKRNETRSDFDLMQLLYRIDIDESRLKKYLAENNPESYYHIIAEQIIKRILQKVVIRKFYKGKE